MRARKKQLHLQTCRQRRRTRRRTKLKDSWNKPFVNQTESFDLWTAGGFWILMVPYRPEWILSFPQSWCWIEEALPNSIKDAATAAAAYIMRLHCVNICFGSFNLWIHIYQGEKSTLTGMGRWGGGTFISSKYSRMDGQSQYWFHLQTQPTSFDLFFCFLFKTGNLWRITHKLFFWFFYRPPQVPPSLSSAPTVGGLPRVCCVQPSCPCLSVTHQLVGPEGWQAERGGETEAVVSVQWAADWRDLTWYSDMLCIYIWAQVAACKHQTASDHLPPPASSPWSTVLSLAFHHVLPSSLATTCFFFGSLLCSLLRLLTLPVPLTLPPFPSTPCCQGGIQPPELSMPRVFQPTLLFTRKAQ